MKNFRCGDVRAREPGNPSPRGKFFARAEANFARGCICPGHGGSPEKNEWQVLICSKEFKLMYIHGSVPKCNAI